MVVADFDGDGRDEFACGGKGGGCYYLYDRDPSGEWHRHTIREGLSPNVGAAAADFDADGKPEIICGEWGPRLWRLSRGGYLDQWRCEEIGTGLRDPHDVLAGDLDGDGRPAILIREKDGRLMIWRPNGRRPGPWTCRVIAWDLPGDGTAIAPLETGGPTAIITNAGVFEPTAAGWRRQPPLLPADLQWHPESRIAAADIDGDGLTEIAVTESEITPARLALLRQDGSGGWTPRVLIDRDAGLGAMHSLQFADLDGDGQLELFTAEMENNKTDGVKHRPRWWMLKRDAVGRWHRHCLLDANLGSHGATVADVDGDGRLELVGKVWRANRNNANHGRNHVDVLMPA